MFFFFLNGFYNRAVCTNLVIKKFISFDITLLYSQTSTKEATYSTVKNKFYSAGIIL